MTKHIRHIFFLTSPMDNVLGIIAIVSEGLNQIGYQKNMIANDIQFHTGKYHH